jgi:hypothetical protein
MTLGLVASRCFEGVAMVKPRTHFEQVPLEVVKKIVEEKAEREQTAERRRAIKTKKLEGALRDSSESLSEMA